MYQIEVLDENNCRNIIETELIQPPLLEVLLTNVTPVDCYGNASGMIETTTVGGVPPYTYEIDGTPSDHGIFGNLIAGEYMISVEDDSSCMTTLNVGISQPDSF